MRAGELNRRVIIEKMVEEKDEFGASLQWIEYCTVWASVSDMTGREFIAAQSIKNEVTTRIIIRKRSDINIKIRIKFEGETYDVIAILNADKNTMMTLMCKKGVSDG